MLKLQYQTNPDLEELLTDHSETYWSTCWSLGNDQSMDDYQTGSIINLIGPCQEHGHHEYNFQLTDTSLLNIARCRGIDTCDEVIRMFGENPRTDKNQNAGP